MKKDNYETKLLSSFTKMLLLIFEWSALILAVVTVGLTILLLLMAVFKGKNLSNELLATLFSYLTSFSIDNTLDLIKSEGSLNVIIAGFGYGLGTTITYFAMYKLINNGLKVFRSIENGKVFTKENLDIIESSVPLSIIEAFSYPVIIFVVIYATRVFEYANINVSGILFICIFFILKLIFEKGYELEQEVSRANTKISNMKATYSEKQMEEIKEKASTKKTTKRTTKK